SVVKCPIKRFLLWSFITPPTASPTSISLPNVCKAKSVNDFNLPLSQAISQSRNSFCLSLTIMSFIGDITAVSKIKLLIDVFISFSFCLHYKDNTFPNTKQIYLKIFHHPPVLRLNDTPLYWRTA